MLGEILPGSVYSYFLIFARLGGALMLLPAIGETYISTRIRLAIGLLLSLVLWPVLEPLIPSQPAQLVPLATLLLGELVIGLFIGTVLRLMMSALSTGGMIIANMSSLANALVQDPTAQQQGSIAGNFLTMTGILMIFLLDLHLMMIKGIADSYEIFQVGATLPAGDFAEMVSRTVAAAFLVGFKIAAPMVCVGIIFYLGLGLLGRLMPQMQVFFVAIPIQVGLGLLVLALCLPIMMQVFLAAFEERIGLFVRF